MTQFIEVTIMGERTLLSLAHVVRVIEREGGDFCVMIDIDGHRYEPAENYEQIRDAIASLGGQAR